MSRSQPFSGKDSVLDAWDRKFILTLDGGGVRGLSSLYILEELMRLIEEIERKPTSSDSTTIAEHSFHPEQFTEPKSARNGMPLAKTASFKYLPCHYFDLVVGTSTGGLIAIMLSRLRMCVRDCIEEYKTLSGEVFGNPRRMHLKGSIKTMSFNPKKDKHHARPLRDAVCRIVEERDPFSGRGVANARVRASIMESPTKLCQTVVFAVEGSGLEGYRFRSFHCKEVDPHFQRGEDTHAFEILDASMATTAAPGYLKPYVVNPRNSMRFFDGGLKFFNPCQEGYREIKAEFGTKNMNKGILAGALSIGTGKVPENHVERPKKWLSFRYREALAFPKRQASNPTAIHQEMKKDERSLNETLDALKCPYRFSYRRFTVGVEAESLDDNFSVPADSIEHIEQMRGMKLDEWKGSDTIEKIRRASQAYVQVPQIQDRLKDFAYLLVQQRRLRSQSDIASGERDPSAAARWCRFASACQWICPKGDCPVQLRSRDSFERHMLNAHGSEHSSTPLARSDKFERNDGAAFYGPNSV